MGVAWTARAHPVLHTPTRNQQLACNGSEKRGLWCGGCSSLVRLSVYVNYVSVRGYSGSPPVRLSVVVFLFLDSAFTFYFLFLLSFSSSFLSYVLLFPNLLLLSPSFLHCFFPPILPVFVFLCLSIYIHLLLPLISSFSSLKCPLLLLLIPPCRFFFLSFCL